MEFPEEANLETWGGRWDRKLSAGWQEGTFEDAGNDLTLGCGDSCTTLYVCEKSLNIRRRGGEFYSR